MCEPRSMAVEQAVRMYRRNWYWWLLWLAKARQSNATSSALLKRCASHMALMRSKNTSRSESKSTGRRRRATTASMHTCCEKTSAVKWHQLRGWTQTRRVSTLFTATASGSAGAAFATTAGLSAGAETVICGCPCCSCCCSVTACELDFVARRSRLYESSSSSSSDDDVNTFCS